MAFMLPFLAAAGMGAAGTAGSKLAGGLGKKLGIPGFKKGGLVRGLPNQGSLAIVHGGEVVLPHPMVGKLRQLMAKPKPPKRKPTKPTKPVYRPVRRKSTKGKRR